MRYDATKLVQQCRTKFWLFFLFDQSSSFMPSLSALFLWPLPPPSVSLQINGTCNVVVVFIQRTRLLTCSSSWEHFFAFLSSAKKYIEPNKIDTTHARTQQKKRSSHSICADYASNRMRVRLVIRYVLLTRPFASARIFVYVWKEVARAGVQNLSSTLWLYAHSLDGSYISLC